MSNDYSAPEGKRLLLVMPPSPFAMDFAQVMGAVAAMYPDLPLSAIDTRDDGSFAVYVDKDAEPGDIGFEAKVVLADSTPAQEGTT